MVGLDKFKDAFEAYSDNYVIIGGTACEITLKDTEMRPRATHDIDMIVIIENITPEFVLVFGISFMKEGTGQKNAVISMGDVTNMNSTDSLMARMATPK